MSKVNVDLETKIVKNQENSSRCFASINGVLEKDKDLIGVCEDKMSKLTTEVNTKIKNFSENFE